MTNKKKPGINKRQFSPERLRNGLEKRGISLHELERRLQKTNDPESSVTLRTIQRCLKSGTIRTNVLLAIGKVTDIHPDYLTGELDTLSKWDGTAGEWIPCSERLPKEIGTYLVTLDYKEHGKSVTTIWYHGKQIGWDLLVADVVIAWMPLPEPWKGAQNKND